MKSSLVFCLMLAVCSNLYAVVDAAAAVQKIDALLAEGWKKHGIEGNATASEEVLLRRLYLDIIGRIPTLEEAQAFLESKDPQKRSLLIDKLLASDGYASHMFNYFADLLRITDAGGKSKITAEAYAEWMKTQLRENTPYDKIVHQLLSTHGMASDSGAIGFYQRDENKLDHLAYAVQVFLGTQIICAQCHDHPFDQWTQMDFYGMAAYTHGINNRGATLDLVTLPASAKKQGFALEDLNDVRKAISGALQPLKYASIKLDERKLPLLPPDYKYQDAKPGDEVPPKVLFGEPALSQEGGTRLQALADWVTSPRNPRFTLVIANRMWKRAFGLGLIEPVDEMMDSSAASNPELMRFLTQLMVDQRYSLKSFQRVLFNTQAYQRTASTVLPEPGAIYHFTGPLPHRMSAEQVWDSIVTLIQGDIDSHVSESNANLRKYLTGLKQLSTTVREKGLEGLAGIAKEARARQEAATAQITKLREEMNARGTLTKKDAQELNQATNKLSEQNHATTMAAILGVPNLDGMGLDYKAQMREQKTMLKGKLTPEEKRKMSRSDQKERLQNQLASTFTDRAAELPSPTRPGHLLRTFGQSDRDAIDNANADSTIPQALALLNSSLVSALSGSDTKLQQHLATAATPQQKMEMLYLSLLSRKPTSAEQMLLQEVIHERGETAADDVTHALMMGAEFLFVK